MESKSRILSIYHDPTGSLLKIYDPNEPCRVLMETQADELHGDSWYRGFAAGFRLGFFCLLLWLSVAVLSGILLVYQAVVRLL